jgi:hypothetical protein
LAWEFNIISCQWIFGVIANHLLIWKREVFINIKVKVCSLVF